MRNFFEQQRIQKRKTLVLVILFFVFVATMSLIIGVASAYAIQLAAGAEARGLENFKFAEALVLPLSALSALVIGGVSLFRILSLKNEGGSAVAHLLGARLIFRDSKDPLHQKLLNVVEEMSIAAGIPAPKCFVIENESSLNALAAGLSPNDSCVVITQGALEMFTRDELQGVMGHEFSHILNGDMNLNVKLTGAIAGLVFISEAGRLLLDAESRSSSSNRKGSGLAPIGLVLLALGSVGVFFARMIQAWISRGREILADASSCQFTRNPTSLATALAKVKYFASSWISSAHSQQTSHFFFAEAVHSWFSTHPPLEDRIRALDASVLTSTRLSEIEASLQKHHPTMEILKNQEPQPAASFQPLHTHQVMQTIGQIQIPQLLVANEKLQSIPSTVRGFLRTTTGAKATVILILAEWQHVVDEGLIELITQKNELTKERVDILIETIRGLSEDMKLNLIFLALPTLKELSLEERKTFLQVCAKLNEAPNSNGLFEFSAWLMVRATLEPGQRDPNRVLNLINVRPILAEIILIFTWLGDLARMPESELKTSTQKALLRLTTQVPPLEEIPRPITSKQIEAALWRIKDIPYAWKQKIIEGMWDCVLFDGKMNEAEIAAARALSAVLGVPVPPLMVGTFSKP